MPIYNVTAWCDKPYYCRMEIEANDAAEALVLAKEQVNDNDAEACDDYYLWDRFQISDAEDGPLATWLDDEARLRDAAPKLLAACQGILASFHESVVTEESLAGFPALAAVAQAIGEATKDASQPEPPPIVIEVRGGVVVEVSNVPAGVRYVVKDWDDEER